MPLVTTEGLILRRIRLGETSKILTVLTPDFGKIKLVAKGARKPRHRYGSEMEPFNLCTIVFYHKQDRDLLLLSQCDTVESFLQFSADIRRLAYGSAVLELADKSVLENESVADIYARVVEAVRRMADARPADLPLLWWSYQLRMLDLLGYRPQLERCGSCGRSVSGNRVRFSPALGGVCCESCAGGEAAGETRVSGGSLRALQFLSSAPWDEIRSLRVSRRQAAEIENLLSRFLAGQFGESFRIRSMEILRSIRRGESSGGFSDAHHAA